MRSAHRGVAIGHVVGFHQGLQFRDPVRRAHGKHVLHTVLLETVFLRLHPGPLIGARDRVTGCGQVVADLS